MSRQKKILIVGFGSISRKYIRFIKAYFPKIEIYILSSKKKNIYEEAYLVHSFYSNFSDLKNINPDGVIIASPATMHLSDSLNFIDFGIPILIEKPLSNNLDNVSYFQKIVKEKKSRILVGYLMRHSEISKLFKKNINNNKLGSSLFSKINCSSYLPDWRPSQDYRRTVSSSSAYGGGVLLELSHEIDYANWFFGPFLKVQAFLRNTGTLEIDVEDIADLVLTNKNGMNVQIHLDFCSRSKERYCTLYGTEATMKLDYLNNKLEIIDPNSNSLLFSQENNPDQMFKNQLDYFLNSVFSGKDFENNLDESIQTLKIIESAKLSNQLNKVIEI